MNIKTIVREREENLVRQVSKVRKAIAEKKDRKGLRDIVASMVYKAYPDLPVYRARRVRLVCQDLPVKTEKQVSEVVLDGKVVQGLSVSREIPVREVRPETRVVKDRPVLRDLPDYPVLLESLVSVTMPRL